MPKLTNRVPSYRRHKQSGQAIVTLNGRDFLLGPHGTQASLIEYDRRIAEWLVSGRQPHATASDGLSLVEAAARYWRHVKKYYVKNGRPTSETAATKSALRFLRSLYANTLAADFSPLALKAVRARMIEAGLSRGSINKHVSRIRRMFKWLAAEQLVPASVFHSLTVVDGLRKGRSNAREPGPVRPVDDATVSATLLHLPEVVADMVRLQRLTGCRPAELCMMRPCDIDRSIDPWRYTPATHKSQHLDRQRVVFVGPKAQGILFHYLARDVDTYCFRPIDSESRRRAARHAARKVAIHFGNRPGTNRRRRPKRTPGDKVRAAG